ncbi:Csu type fimbrial protein [Acinetobacter larvae]|uniref:Protein CsuA n=1 Tax=Acinetobacter larvae TaxID=1789224 RepID=A0A1B2LVT4_9GAMM|nr:spore coat U domain-containing protein [Acinetobacter larvae]AOA57050.1 protein CsuA [Acinetobacter larvae]
MNIVNSLSAAVLLALSINSAFATNVTGQVEVKLEVSAGCSVDGSSVNGSINKFGDLDFGKASASLPNVLTAEVSAAAQASKLAVKCDGTDDVAFTVAIDGGLRGDRQLKNAADDNTIHYNVYRNAARSDEYRLNDAQQFNAKSGAATEIPIYGSIAPTELAGKSQGTYTDTLLVSVSF